MSEQESGQVSEQEKEAIKYLKKHIIPYNNINGNLEFLVNDVLLNLIEKQQKVIDLMVKELAIPGKSIEIINLYNNVSPDKSIYDLVKEYFYKKAEEENE